MKGLIQIVGIGPGDAGSMSYAVRLSIENADILLGYKTYLDLIDDISPAIPRESSGMGQEVARAQRALTLACEGKRVVLVSDGDAGVYGMVGLVFDILRANEAVRPKEWLTEGDDFSVEVLPGITALSAAAALLGAPLMTDFAAISLSDHLTASEDILRRIRMAAQAGFILCLYNPNSHHRKQGFDDMCQVLSKTLPSDTPVGVVRNAFRPDQKVMVIHLAELIETDVDMRSIIIVGNQDTYIWHDKMVTARGYARKYRLEINP